mgnify:CR=1 FL=1
MRWPPRAAFGVRRVPRRSASRVRGLGLVAPNDELIEKLKSNLQEVRARGGEMFVFVVKDGAVEKRRIRIGERRVGARLVAGRGGKTIGKQIGHCRHG